MAQGCASSALSPEVICWLLGSICFAFSPPKYSKWKVVIQASEFVTYIHHWLYLSDERWKWETFSPPGGPAAHLSIGLWSKPFIYPLLFLQHCQKSAESWCRNSLYIYLTCRNVVILIWIQCSKVLHLPFSVLGLTWCALLTATTRRSVSAHCKQCLSAL